MDTGALELEQSEALLQTEEQLLLLAREELAERGKLKAKAAPRRACEPGRLLSALVDLVDHAYFGHAIMLLIVLNTALMMCEHHDMSPELVHFLEEANVVLTSCFTAEMLLKLAAHGCGKYFSDPFSRFDAVVVFASLLELLLDYTHVSIGINPSFLRAFRLMRAFKLARSWKGLQKILQCVLVSRDGMVTPQPGHPIVQARRLPCLLLRVQPTAALGGGAVGTPRQRAWPAPLSAWAPSRCLGRSS